MNPWLHPFLQLSDAVIITDANHIILAVNHAYERITGFEGSFVTGHRAGVLKSGHTPERTYQHMKETLRSGRSWSGVFTNRKKDLTLWHSSITITPFALDGAVYYVGIFRELEQLNSGFYLPETRIFNFQSAMFRLLAICSEIRDPGIEGHLTRVQRLTGMLMEEHYARLGLKKDAQFIAQVSHASVLHDIGKSGIPESILYKPDRLTLFERSIMEMHTSMGVEILEKIESEFEEELLLQEIAVARNIILHHHEKWDGTGYPHRLAGGDIPLEARIVSLVDIYDALVSKRAYKEAWPKARALDYIAEQSGAFFDPALTESFLAMAAKLPEHNEQS